MSFELRMQPVGPEAKAVAEKELREIPENIQEGLAQLKKYLEEDKKLHFKTDDDFLLIFLRPCKFYANSAYELMKRVAEFKEKNAVLFDSILPADEKVAILEHNVVNVLKSTDHKGRRVLFVNCGKTWDPSKVCADQILRLLYLVHLMAMQEPETQVISEHIFFSSLFVD